MTKKNLVSVKPKKAHAPKSEQKGGTMAFLKSRIELSSAYNALDKEDFNALLNFVANYSDEIDKIHKIENFVKATVKAATPNRVGKYVIKGCTVKVTRQPKKTTDSYLQKTVTVSKKKTR